MTQLNTPVVSSAAVRLMSNKSAKFKVVKTVDFMPIDYANNVRESHNVAPLKADIKAKGGLETIPLVELLKDGKYRILRGYRRITSIVELSQEEPNDTRWAEIKVQVLEGLDEAERVELTLDHGNTKPLEKHEVFFAAEKMFDARVGGTQEAFTQQQVAVTLETLLALHYPPKRKLKAASEDGGAEIGAYRRGIIQSFLNAHRLPTRARAEYVKMLKGEQSWPNKKDVTDLLKLFEDAKKADPTYSTSQELPGKEWDAKFDEYVADHQASEETGETTKQLGIMTAKTLEMHQAASTCPLVKKLCAVILRKDKDSDAHFAVMDAVLNEVFPTMTPDQQKRFFNVQD